MADLASSSEPSFFSYFSPEELTTIRSHLPPHLVAGTSMKELIEKCVGLVGESRVLAAVRSQLPVPTYSWTSHTVVVSARQVARWGHSLTVVDDRLYLYGGRGTDQCCRSSFYYLDLRSLRAYYIKTNRFPKAREGHTCVRHKETLYLYGGCEGGGDEPEIFFADFNAFDLRSKKWRNVRASGDPPSGRDGHSCGILEDRMLVYGGNTAEGLSEDVFTFYFPKGLWTKHQTVGWNPGKRESSGSCVIRNTMFLFGGNVNGDRNRDDICANDLFTFRLLRGEVVCEQVRTFGQTPPPRVSHTLTAVDEHSFILIGGEKDGVLLNDVWVYFVDYCCWSQVQSHTPLPSKMAHCAIAYQSKVWIFGGMDKDSQPRSELLTISLHNHPFLPSQQEASSPAPLISYEKCMKCGHKPLLCEQFEDGLRFPGFNYFSRIVTSVELVREVAEHYAEPYLPLLAIARLIGGTILKVDLVASEVQNAGHSQSEASSDSSTSTSADGSPSKVLQLQSNSMLEPEKLFHFFSTQHLGLLAAVSSLAVFIMRSDFLSVLIIRFLEDTVQSFLLVYDKEGNCIYPEQSLYLKTLEMIVKVSGFPLVKLMAHGNGSTVYLHSKLYSKRVGTISAPAQHPVISLHEFMQYAYQRTPAPQQFIVANGIVQPRFAPEVPEKVERNARFVKWRFRGVGPSSTRVYFSNELVYLWVEEATCQKRPRSESVEHLVVELLSEKYLHSDKTLNVQLAWEVLALEEEN